MKAMIVYDSFFNNTAKIAQSMKESLEKNKCDTTIHRVNEISAKNINNIDALIVGSPTRAFRPTRSINHFLNRIPKNRLKGVKVVAFDTRADIEKVNSKFLNIMVKWFGYAAKPIADKLVKKGGTLVSGPEGFYVNDTEGPLKEGEIERASEWVRLSFFI